VFVVLLGGCWFFCGCFLVFWGCLFFFFFLFGLWGKRQVFFGTLICRFFLSHFRGFVEKFVYTSDFFLTGVMYEP